MERKTALLSVYNKEGIANFARQLVGLGWDIIASGGTARKIKREGVPVKDIATFVGGKAILGHRVVTLSREIHAALLSRDIPEDKKELARIKIPRIDLLCVDLYPLQKEMQDSKSTTESIIEKTDVGGPALLRSAAKGRRIVICRPEDRSAVLKWLKNNEPEKEKFISALVSKAEATVSDYCLSSARYHSNNTFNGIIGEKIIECAYGENAWQTPAGFYKNISANDPLGLENFKIISGMAPSYNNICDIDRMLQTITHIAAAYDYNFNRVPLIAVGVKHGNACGAAIGKNPITVLEKMLEGDPLAIFGGFVMTNFLIGKKEAAVLLNYLMPHGQRRLLDGVIGSEIKSDAIEMLKRKGAKCRLISNAALKKLNGKSLDHNNRFRYARGGFLMQPNYTFILNLRDKDLIKTRQLSASQESNLLFAWAIGSTSNSNTITLVKNSRLIGNGVGQQARVYGCKLAIQRFKDSGHNLKNAAAYSDSFFSFEDGIKVLKKAGISTILATNGSVNDERMMSYCKKNKITLYLIPDKKARGFFGH